MLACDFSLDHEGMHHVVIPTNKMILVVLPTHEACGHQSGPEEKNQSCHAASQGFPRSFPQKIRHEQRRRDLTGDCQTEDNAGTNVALTTIGCQSGHDEKEDEQVDVSVL